MKQEHTQSFSELRNYEAGHVVLYKKPVDIYIGKRFYSTILQNSILNVQLNNSYILQPYIYNETCDLG